MCLVKGHSLALVGFKPPNLSTERQLNAVPQVTKLSLRKPTFCIATDVCISLGIDEADQFPFLLHMYRPWCSDG